MISNFWDAVPARIKDLFAIDFRALAAFRILLGLMIILDLVQRLFDITAFYTDFGFAPRATVIETLSSHNRWSVYFGSGELWYILLLFFITFVVALCLMAGYKTRVSIILSWILLFSLHNRNELVLQGGDNFFHIMVFWSMFLPLGARFSLDNLWNPNPNFEAQTKYNSLFTFAYMAQIVMAFLFAGFLKYGPEWTQYYSATLIAGHVNYIATPIGRWATNFVLLTQIWTLYLKWTEIVLPIIMFIPFKNWILRSVSIILLCAMLIGCGLGLWIITFPLLWMVALVPFIPSQIWDYVSKKLSPPKAETEQLTFYFDQDCTMCTSVACAIQNRVKIAATQSDPEIWKKMLEENTMTVIDSKGNRFYEFDAILKLMENVAWTSWLAKQLNKKIFKKPGQKCYKWLANNRFHISNFLDFIKPGKPLNISSWPLQIFTTMLITLMLFWNINEFRGVQDLPQPIIDFTWKIGLNQRWDMFAPYPLKSSGWFVMPGKLADGTDIDAFNQKVGAVNWEQRFDPPAGMQSQGWRKIFTDFLPNTGSGIHLQFGGYMCRSYNSGVPAETPDSRLQTFDIYFMKMTYDQQGKLASGPEKIKIWEHRCF